MLFTFKRDEEGRERIYVGDVFVAHVTDGLLSRPDGEGWSFRPVNAMQHVTAVQINDAIERADEAGFWQACDTCQGYDCGRRYDEVTVDVPVAETSTTLVVVREGDE